MDETEKATWLGIALGLFASGLAGGIIVLTMAFNPWDYFTSLLLSCMTILAVLVFHGMKEVRRHGSGNG